MASKQQEDDEAILAQVEALKKEVTNSGPAVGDLEPIESLLEEFANSEVFATKIKNLMHKFKHLRRVRRDGNCFYRALLFARLEDLVNRAHAADPAEATHAKLEFEKLQSLVKQSLKGLTDLGYPDVCEDFQESMLELLQSLDPQEATTSKEEKLALLLETCREFGSSSSLIMYLRLLTSLSLQTNQDLFAPFVQQPIKSFCSSEVELMEQEADHPQVSALSLILQFGLELRYLDLSPGDSCNSLLFQDELPVRVTMLYRPGHYDLLYP